MRNYAPILAIAGVSVLAAATLPACADGVSDTETTAGAGESSETGAGEGEAASTGEGTTGGDEAAYTFTQDIRPLIASRCLACHTEGGAAPFSLRSYDEAKTWAAVSADSVAHRRMPPYYADNSGDCGNFRHSAWLTEAEVAAFRGWVDAGTPLGDPNIPVPPEPEIPKLVGPTLAMDIGVDYLPDQSESDDYQCFVVDSPGGLQVTGYDVIPGNPAIVHHMIVYQLSAPSELGKLQGLVDADPDPGFDCPGTGPQVDAVSLAGWAPGQGAIRFPGQLGMDLDPNMPIIIEMHYNTPGGPGQTDRSQLVWELAETADLVPLSGFEAYDFSFVAPPGQASYVTTQELAIADEAFLGRERMRLVGVGPHMHTLGVSQKLEIIRADGRNECVLDLVRWDFNWQNLYWYDEAIVIERGDRVRITCEFDTRGREATVTWGDGTLDEMCLASFMTEPM